MTKIDVEKLRGLAAALNRAEDKYPNPFYVGFGAGILEAIGDQPADIWVTTENVNRARTEPTRED